MVISGAGGVGSLAVQLGKPFGAGRVIATASTEEKRELTRSLGADAAVDSAEEDLTAALIEANEGQRVDVVLEMSGGRVFEQSADALAPFGRIVAYGIAGREQNTLETGRLMRKSRSVVGFWLMHCLGRREMMEEPLADLFERTARGDLRRRWARPTRSPTCAGPTRTSRAAARWGRYCWTPPASALARHHQAVARAHAQPAPVPAPAASR